ncbi:hypothetical protein F4779DRAFT_423709 [Xylariaceae sp. FL0662B]|nr:hypothetical protein F4779DRAFT_423709 [Xylariaceae sp. FL0662B]
MAILTEEERQAQSSVSVVVKNAHHAQHQRPPPTADQGLNVAHLCSRAQWLPRQLSRKTLHKYLQVIPVPLPIPKHGSRLDLLPQNIINRICQYVPYEKLIWLSQESHALRMLINPQLAPYETKLSFVLRAERDFKKHYEEKPPNQGCYMCCQVLPAGWFASNQPLQALLRNGLSAKQSVVHLRRFCIRCGVRSGCHGPGAYLVTGTGERLWICECAEIRSVEQVSNCTVCGAICPYRAMGGNSVVAAAEVWV